MRWKRIVHCSAVACLARGHVGDIFARGETATGREGTGTLQREENLLRRERKIVPLTSHRWTCSNIILQELQRLTPGAAQITIAAGKKTLLVDLLFPPPHKEGPRI